MLKSSAAAIATAAVIGRANAAEFSLKYGNDLPAAHPINTRAREAVEAIKAATNGRLEIEIFPNSQLGGDTDMFSQVRSGAIDIFTIGSPIVNAVPIAAIPRSRSPSRPWTRCGPRSTATSARMCAAPSAPAST